MNIVVDMDETLIASEGRHVMQTDLPLIYLGVVDGMADSIILRPHIEQFLQFCQENFDNVYLCSFSSTARVKRVLSVGGIGHYFKSVYGLDDLEDGDGPNLGRFVLVDDHPIESGIVQGKLYFFGFSNKVSKESDYYRSVQPFHGLHTDEGLLDMMKILGGLVANA